MAWPPELADLKRDLGIEPGDTRDDIRLADQLAAAVAFTERVHDGWLVFDPLAAPLSALPAPPEDVVLGTIRLAGRWYSRRRSPDGLVAAGDFGTVRVGSGDGDIDRLLRIGRYRRPVIA